jgi:hypothetical protein
MSLTGQQLLDGFSTFINDYWSSTATTAASDGTTVVDTLLRRYGDDSLRDFYFRNVHTGHVAINQVRRATGYASATGIATVAPAFGALLDSGESYEMHRYDPASKFSALDGAIRSIANKLFKATYDESITTDGINRTYSIPSTVRRGPLYVQIEEPVAANAPWNFLADPDFDSTSNWTESNFTAAQVTWQDNDPLIPKYGSTATKLTLAASVTGTYTMPVANMAHSITATLAAGRQMSLGIWIYTRTASKIKIGIIDDSTTSYSTQHGGNGWELLTVTATPPSTNATTLSVVINGDNDSSPVVAWANKGWLLFGPRVPNHFNEQSIFKVRRDDTTQTFTVPNLIMGKRQLRLVGSTPLSRIGTTVSTQPTNTVEVDEFTAELLYAKAAVTLFGREALTTANMNDIATRVQIGEERLAELQRLWRFEPEQKKRIQGPFS